MPVLAIFRAEGDPDDLVARYDRTLAAATATSPTRPEMHVCVRTDSGFMIVDIWRSRDDLLQGVIENEEFQAAWDAADWPKETREVYEIHNQGWPAS
jgi:hypothetical protein